MSELGAQPQMPVIYYGRPDRITAFFQRNYAKAPAWFGPLAVLFCIASGLAYTVLTKPAGADAYSNPNCLLKLTTGFDCPGCGGTRAAWFLIHGDLAAAARHHVIVVFAAPFLLYLYLSWAGKKLFKRRVLPPLNVTPAALSWGLGAWALYSVLRNLPWAPFTALYV